MKLEELLGSSIIEFPSDQTENTYLGTIKKRFTDYQKDIADLNDSPIGYQIKLLSTKIQNLCASLEKSVELHLSGNTYESYIEFKNGISCIDSEFRLWYSEQIDIRDDILRKLYKIRVEEKPLSDKKEMFHIPFNLRHLVKTQRYSIPGLPCLYFGSSSYISWKEMGKPLLDNVYISRFEANQKITILDLGKDHRAIEHMIKKLKFKGHSVPLIESLSLNLSDEPTKLVISWFALFPLLVATSIRQKHPGTDFCDAYILSQHLMQFIRNDPGRDIDGIRYVSTKHQNDIANSFVKDHCWAFPVKTLKDEGHCPELTKLFTNTEIQSWRFREKLIAENIDDSAMITTEHLPGYSIPYHKTIWGKSEAELWKLDANPI